MKLESKHSFGLQVASLLFLLALGTGLQGCIEAAPFEAGEDGSGSPSSDVDPGDASGSDAQATDTIAPEVDGDSDGEVGGDAEDGQSPVDATADLVQTDSGPEDTVSDAQDAGPCEGAGCPCDEAAPCDDGLTCVAGACCQPSCPEAAQCGSDGCGGSCGACDDGLACDEDQSCGVQCEPGSSVCGVGDQADYIYTCDADGIGFDDQVAAHNCAASSEICAQGACQCVPSCDEASCLDDGEPDGCGGECPSTCKDVEICDAEGKCVEEGCTEGEVVCHEGAPYSCAAGNLALAIEDGPVVDCGPGTCKIQSLSGAGDDVVLEDKQLYCTCEKGQYCLDEEYMFVCNADGGAAIYACQGTTTCDSNQNACVTPEPEPEEATTACCKQHLGSCGWVDECSGTCSCTNPDIYPDGYECNAEQLCVSECDPGQIGQGHCLMQDPKLFEVCSATGWQIQTCDAGYTCGGTAGQVECVPADDVPSDYLALALNTAGEPCDIQGTGTAPNDGAFDFHKAPQGTGDGAFTISMWIYGSNLYDGEGQIVSIVRKGGKASTTGAITPATGQWILFVKDGRFYWMTYNASDGHGWYRRSKQVANNKANGMWAHLVMTYSGTSGATSTPHQNTRFYLNGTDVTDYTGAGTGSTNANENATYTSTTQTANPLQVGFAPEQSEPFAGVIDDLAFLATYVGSTQIDTLTYGDLMCGADLLDTDLAYAVQAFWRFEDMNDSDDAVDGNKSWDLVQELQMTIGGCFALYDSPCSVSGP